MPQSSCDIIMERRKAEPRGSQRGDDSRTEKYSTNQASPWFHMQTGLKPYFQTASARFKMPFPDLARATRKLSTSLDFPAAGYEAR